MRLGVFTALLAKLPLDEVIRKLRSLGVKTIELGTGNYPGDPHCKLAMLQGVSAFKEFKKKLDDSGFTISALSCHGNALHPDRDIAKAHREVSRKTVQLAAKLSVPVVVDCLQPGAATLCRAAAWTLIGAGFADVSILMR